MSMMWFYLLKFYLSLVVFMKTEAFWLKLLGFLNNSMWEPAHIWFQELIIKFLELWDGW